MPHTARGEQTGHYTGKLTKKEQRMMKKTHKDIGWMLSPPTPPEVINHERVLEKEVESMEVVDREKEERLKRVRRRALEWKVQNECRAIIEDLIGDAKMESEWRQGICRGLVLESVDDAILESRSRLCKEMLVETVLTAAWEVLEVKRIVKEATNGGLLEKVETELRMIRKERECVRMIMLEEEAQSKRLEKVDRLTKAWLLKMNAMKYQRMVGWS